MKITITLENSAGLPDIIEFKDKNGEIQNLKLEEDFEPVSNTENTYVCEDAYFLGTACDEYDSELEYFFENITEIANDFEQDIYFLELKMEENENELYAKVIEDEDNNSVYKKLQIDKPVILSSKKDKTEIKSEKIENSNQTEEVKTQTEKTENEKLEESEELVFPDIESCEKFGMSYAEYTYYQKQEIKEQNKEREQDKDRIKEKIIEKPNKTIVQEEPEL